MEVKESTKEDWKQAIENMGTKGISFIKKTATNDDIFHLQKGEGDFGAAVRALKSGALVARSVWNGKGMFIFLRPSDKLSVEVLVNNVKSLPDSLKKNYQGKFAWTQNEATDGNGPDKAFVEFTAYLCMKAADGTIVNGWLASQTDMLAEDWQILE